MLKSKKKKRGKVNVSQRKQKILKVTEKQMYNKNLRDKIHTLWANDAKEYWHLLNKAQKGKTVQN